MATREREPVGIRHLTVVPGNFEPEQDEELAATDEE